MARTLLGAAAVVWIVAGVVGTGIGLVAASDLQRVLPRLTIDLSALGGAVVAVSAAVLGIGVVHLVLLAAMRRGHRAARSAATIVAGALAALFVALSAAAVTTAVTTPDRVALMLFSGAAATAAAVTYGVIAVLLVAETRARGQV